MIRMTNWVADIPAEDKRIAYMGEHETCQRQFLLTGEDAIRYMGWTFRLDMQFDVSTVSSSTTLHTEHVEEEREKSLSETLESEQTSTTKESRTVTEVTVACGDSSDIAYLTQEPREEGLLLTWTVRAQHTRLPGRLWATLRAQNAEGAVKKSAMMLFTVDKAVEATPSFPPSFNEFEQMEHAMDGRLVALEELTQTAIEAAQTAGAHATTVSADKQQTAVYKQQAEDAASTAEAAAEQAIEAADGVHKSAYDIAVENGFKGTEKEWLESLKGEQGATTEEIDAAAALAADAAERANLAAQNANGAAGGVVIIEQNGGLPLCFWVGTQAEYDALAEKDANCFYLISDDKMLEDLNVQVDALQGIVVGHGTSIGELKSRDYVVEQGESVVGADTWRYRKWYSGHAECWCSASRVHPENNGEDGTDAITYSMTFPFAVANPMVQSQVGAYGWNIARPLYEAVGERGMSVTLYPRTDVGGSSYIINIHVIGNWK